MTIDQCEEAYIRLSQEIFTPRRSNSNILGKASDFVNASGRFSTEALEASIKSLIRSTGKAEDEVFNDARPDACKMCSYFFFQRCLLTGD